MAQSLQRHDIRCARYRCGEQCQHQHASGYAKTEKNGQGAGRPRQATNTSPGQQLRRPALVHVRDEVGGTAALLLWTEGELKAGAEALEKIAKNDDQQKDDKPSEGLPMRVWATPKPADEDDARGQACRSATSACASRCCARRTRMNRGRRRRCPRAKKGHGRDDGRISPRDEDELSKKASGVLQYMANGIQTFVTKASRFGWRLDEHSPGKIWQFYGQDGNRGAAEPHNMKLCRKAGLATK